MTVYGKTIFSAPCPQHPHRLAVNMTTSDGGSRRAWVSCSSNSSDASISARTFYPWSQLWCAALFSRWHFCLLSCIRRPYCDSIAFSVVGFKNCRHWLQHGIAYIGFTRCTNRQTQPVQYLLSADIECVPHSHENRKHVWIHPFTCNYN